MVIVLKQIEYLKIQTSESQHNYNASEVLGDLSFDSLKDAKIYVDRREKNNRRENGYTELHRYNWKTRLKSKNKWSVIDRDHTSTTITTYQFHELKHCKMLGRTPMIL